MQHFNPIYSRRQVALSTLACVLAFLVLGTAIALLGPTLTSLSARFDLPLENAGIFTALQFLGVTVGVIIAGRMIDRLPARVSLISGAMMLAAGFFILSAAQTLPVAMFAIVLYGMGFGTLDVVPNVVIAALNPDNAGGALNALNIFFGLGGILGPQLVNFALSRQNYTLAYIIVALAALVLIVPSLTMSIRTHTDQTTAAPPIVWRSLVPFGILFFAYVGIEAGVASWTFMQLTHVALSTAATATIAVSLFWAGLTVGRVLAIGILRRITSLGLVTLCAITVIAGAALLIVIGQSETISLLSAFLIGVGCGPMFPTVLAVASALYPKSRGAISGVLIAVANIGAIIWPWLQGQVGAGQNGGMIVPLALAVVVLVLTRLIARQVPASISIQTAV